MIALCGFVRTGYRIVKKDGCRGCLRLGETTSRPGFGLELALTPSPIDDIIDINTQSQQ